MARSPATGPARAFLAEAFFDAATTRTALLDEELRCVLVSEPLAATAAISPCEGRAFGEAFPDIAPLIEPVLRLVLEAATSVRDVELPRAASGARWVMSAFVVHYPDAPKYVGMTLESATTPAAPAARDREALFRAIFEHAAVGMLVMEWHGMGVRINAAFERIFGYSAEELASIGVKGITHPEDWEIDLQQFQRLMAGEIDHYQLVKRYLRKDGALVWGNLVVSIARDERGEPDLVISMLEDVSERVRAEAALHQAQDQMLQSQKMEAIGRLAGGIAHDFNNILSIVLSQSSLTLRSLRPDDPAREHVLDVKAAAERAADLTRQLLAFSRQQVLHRAVVDLNAIARTTERMLRRLLGDDIEVSVLTEAAPGLVIADAGQVGQILMNLAVNARDAMPGGGRLKIETKNADVDGDDAAREVAVGRYVMLSVSDTGDGMDASTRARIFEPFFTTKELGKGTGLGLATVFGIVKQSGGHITVTSQPGQGATFRVFLPRPDAAPAPASPARAGS